MATVKKIIEKAVTKVNGEYEVLAESSSDFKNYLSVLNIVMGNWFDTPYVKWQSLFDMDFTLPDPVALGKLDYAVPNSENIEIANTPFDSIYFIKDGEVVAKYIMTDQAFFDSTSRKQVCMMTDDTLYLKDVTPDIVGATIRVPAYVRPPEYTTGSQEVVVDSVSWLVSAMATFVAESSPVPFIARNADKYAKESEKFLRAMKANNSRRQHLVKQKYDGGSMPHSWADVMDNMSLKDL